MARYFFDVPDADIADPNELVDVHDAREAGLRALAAIMRESHPDGTKRAFEFNVCDEAGRHHLHLTITLEWRDAPGHPSMASH
jgi:hypothetical protein